MTTVCGLPVRVMVRSSPVQLSVRLTGWLFWSVTARFHTPALTKVAVPLMPKPLVAGTGAPEAGRVPAGRNVPCHSAPSVSVIVVVPVSVKRTTNVSLPVAADQRVDARAAMDHVIARTAVHDVVAAADEDQVVAVAAVDRVGLRCLVAGDDEVTAAQTVHRDARGGPAERVAREHVVALGQQEGRHHVEVHGRRVGHRAVVVLHRVGEAVRAHVIGRRRVGDDARGRVDGRRAVGGTGPPP